MATTRQIPQGEWQRYFDAFTRQHLKDTGGVVTVQALSPRLGDQVFASNARLIGLAYDPRAEVLEALLEGSDHLVFRPAQVWVLEGDSEDRIATFEFVRRDGIKEILHVQGGGAVIKAPPGAAA